MAPAKIKVLLLNGVPASAHEVFKKAHFEVEVESKNTSTSDIIGRIQDYHVIGVSDKTAEILDDEVLRCAHRLLAVGVFSEHIHGVDIKTCTEMGIPVFNSPYGQSRSVGKNYY